MGKLSSRFGNMLLAWSEGFDALGNGFVNENEFITVCRESGYTGPAKMLYRMMLPYKGCMHITLEDFDKHAYSAMARGDFRMLCEEHDQKSQMEKTFEERQTSGFKLAMERAYLQVQRDPDYQGAAKIPKSDEAKAVEAEEFEQLCVRRYGSVV